MVCGPSRNGRILNDAEKILGNAALRGRPANAESFNARSITSFRLRSPEAVTFTIACPLYPQKQTFARIKVRRMTDGRHYCSITRRALMRQSPPDNDSMLVATDRGERTGFLATQNIEQRLVNVRCPVARQIRIGACSALDFSVSGIQHCPHASP